MQLSLGILRVNSTIRFHTPSESATIKNRLVHFFLVAVVKRFFPRHKKFTQKKFVTLTIETNRQKSRKFSIRYTELLKINKTNKNKQTKQSKLKRTKETKNRSNKT